LATNAHPDRFLPPDPRVEEPYRVTSRLALRTAVLGVIVLGVFAVLFLRLWALQVLQGVQYRKEANSNQVRHIPVSAPRGVVLDRNGRLLVTNVAASSVLLWPADLPKRAGRDTEIRRLAKLLLVSRKTIIAKIKQRAGDPITPVTLQIAVHRDQIDYILEHRDEFPGVKIGQTYLRRYEAEALGSHVLGYDGQITQAELDAKPECARAPYHGGDVVGQSGVEASYDCYLRGRPGLDQLTVDARAKATSPISPVRPAYPGDSVRLTLDITLQRAAERAIRYGIGLARSDGHWASNGGSIVAMDPRDGSILAMASNPTYSPGLWVGRGNQKRLAKLLDPTEAKKANYPGLNRATDGLYPAGSTFKPVTAIAALETPSLDISAYQTLPCTGTYTVPGVTGASQVFKNWDPNVNQEMDLRTAIAASCDTYFYQLGFRFYGLPASAGSPFQAWASRFGFGHKTGLDIGPEAAGLLPTPKWRQQTFTKKTDPCCWEIDRLWKPGDSIQLAIGQKDLLVTPLQMTRFYAMVATGKIVTPHVLLDIEDPGSAGKQPQVKQAYSGRGPRASGIEPGILEVVRQGLYAATHDINGTATSVFGSYPIPIAGKTGTAEKVVPLPGYPAGHTEDQSWWCGYAPANNPTITVCALIENGGHGGTAAAPAALKVFESYFHQPGVYIPPSNSD
jgi:penicillin-binding protein 2